MANTFAPSGFLQYQGGAGGAPTFAQSVRRIASGNTTPIFTGDPVQPVTSTANGYITQATAGGSVQTLRAMLKLTLLMILTLALLFSLLVLVSLSRVQPRLRLLAFRVSLLRLLTPPRAQRLVTQRVVTTQVAVQRLMSMLPQQPTLRHSSSSTMPFPLEMVAIKPLSIAT